MKLLFSQKNEIFNYFDQLIILLTKLLEKNFVTPFPCTSRTLTCLVCLCPLSNPCGVPLCCRRAAGVQGEEQEDAGGNGGRLPGHTEHVTHTPCLLSPLLYSTHYCYNKQKNHTKYNIQKNQTTHTEHTPFVYSKQNKNSDCGDYL